ncbi:mRNA decay activator protein ZFP36L2-A-like [Rhinoraja longicauda]
MTGFRELCELVSELSFLDPDDFSAWKPGPESRAVGPPAAPPRRYSTSQLPLSACRGLGLGLGVDTCCPPGLGLGLREPSEWEEEEEEERQGEPLPPSPSPSARYKTELCRPFQESSFCRYGDKCQFAHGLAELRSLSRHPKYKTEPCRTFHTTGFCPYGTRCHFIHNPEEERGPRPRLRQSASLGSASSGPALDWAALKAAFSPDLELELARTLGLGLGKGGGGGCCCHQHHRHHHQPLQRAPGLPMAGRSPSADSLSDQDDTSSSGSESPVFEQGRRLPIFSRISVSD